MATLLSRLIVSTDLILALFEKHLKCSFATLAVEFTCLVAVTVLLDYISQLSSTQLGQSVYLPSE